MCVLFQPQVRSLSLECIKVWSEQCGPKELFDNEMIADAFKKNNQNLHTELWQWLADTLPNGK